MTIREAYQVMVELLETLYDPQESRNIADWVIENVTGHKRIDRVTRPDHPLEPGQQEKLATIRAELGRHRPVQYVLAETWFAGMKLFVDENVLIPRPETEELVEWIAHDEAQRQAPRILDIGTGSGCIAIALKKVLPKSTVRAIEVSAGAMAVATRNAIQQGVQVYFSRADFLDETQWDDFSSFDVIVSNPPYIPASDAATLHPHVIGFEPHGALFVPENDPLLFYRKISTFAKTHLRSSGVIYLEINESLGNQVAWLFHEAGFQTEIRKDLQGKDRMVKAW